MKKQRVYKVTAVLAAAALCMSGCGGTEATVAEQKETQIAVKAVTAENGELVVSNQFIGTAAPQQQVSIIPLVSGKVDAVYAEVGDEVQAGDVLFHIEDDAARLQAESAALAKQGAENAAKMQLGSAQVMSNLSMESNIRSIEYQIELTKDQYQSAVDGIADAEEAKEDMKDAKKEIKKSIESLENSQKAMKDTIREARESGYIEEVNFLKGEYKWKEEYKSEWGRPDEYDWSEEKPDAQDDQGSLDTNTGSGTGGIQMQQPPANTVDTPSAQEDPNAEAGTDATVPDTEEPDTEKPDTEKPETTPSESAPTETDSEIESTESAPTESESESAEPQTRPDTPAEQPSEPESNAEDAEAESTQADTADIQAEATGSYAWFSEERVRNAEGVYLVEDAVPVMLAENGKEPFPDPSVKTEEEAWEKYNEQQKINEMKSRVETMGYSASDIMTGKAEADMVKNETQIVALQYQLSQLESGISGMDSSIKSAESGKETADKTIDFYEDNLESAQVTYGIQNGQAYQDTAAALANQIQSADVGVKSAQLQLEFYSPKTPISGTVVSKGVELYGMAQPGYAAYVISNQDAMNVTFSVSEKVKNTLQVGMQVTIEKNGNRFDGTITEIGEAVDMQSGGLFKVEAVTEADSSQLPAGASVKLYVDTYRTENAVIVPYDAVHFESEHAYVFVIEDGRAVNTPVTVGLMNDDMVEITEGLTAGSQVVATWSAQLEDGAAVRVIGEDQTEAGTDIQEQTQEDTDSQEQTQEAAE